MENLSSFAAVGFSSLENDDDINQLSFLDRITKTEPQTPIGLDSASANQIHHTTEDVTRLQDLLQDNERCNSVETVSSASSVFAPSPAITNSDSELSLNGLDGQNSIDLETSELPEDTVHRTGNYFLNINGKRNSSSSNDQAAAKKRRYLTGTYKRNADKPPYSYQGLIITAIQNSKDKQLTLGGVQEWLKQHFEFFRGTYTGWRDSIRHNLSSSKCFYKETKDAPAGKPRRIVNYWKVDLSKVSADVFRRQESKLGKSGLFAPFIHEELGLPKVLLSPGNEEDDRVKEFVDLKALQIPYVSTATKRPRSKEAVTVELPKKIGKLHENVSESPEVLRHSRLTNQKTDTPSPFKMTKMAAYDTFSPETPPVTSAVCHILDFLSHTEKHSSAHDAAQNLSLLCGLNEDRLDLNTSFQEREEDKCSEKSPSPETYAAFNITNKYHPGQASSDNLWEDSFHGDFDFRTSASTPCSFYPEFHQSSTCYTQNTTSRCASLTSHLFNLQEPVLAHHYPVVCQFQGPATFSHLHYTSPMSSWPEVPRYTPSYLSDRSFGDDVVVSYGVAGPARRNCETETNILENNEQTIEQDDSRSCLFASVGVKVKIESDASALTEIKKESMG